MIIVDVEPSGGVEDDGVDALLPGGLDAALRDLDGDTNGLAVLVALVGLAVEVNLRAAGHVVVDGVGDDLELFNGGGSLKVGRDEHGGAALLLEVGRDLAAGRGLSGALEAGHHDDGRAGTDSEDRLGGLRWVEGGIERLAGVGDLAAEEPNQLLVNDADHLLTGLEALGNVTSERVLDHALAESVHDVQVDVGFEEAGAHLFHGLADVGLGDGPASGELPEDAVEAVAQAIEHVDGSLMSGLDVSRALTADRRW